MDRTGWTENGVQLSNFVYLCNYEIFHKRLILLIKQSLLLPSYQ